MQGEGQKTQVAPTDWATDFPVWATENPVAQTVMAKTPTVWPVNKGDFRVGNAEILVELTIVPADF